LPAKELAALATVARDELHRARDDIFMEGHPANPASAQATEPGVITKLPRRSSRPGGPGPLLGEGRLAGVRAPQRCESNAAQCTGA
jgi:hypothetical protein